MDSLEINYKENIGGQSNSSSDFKSKEEKINLCRIVDIDEKVNSKPFSDIFPASDSSCLLFDDENGDDLSYEDILNNYNSISN